MFICPLDLKQKIKNMSEILFNRRTSSGATGATGDGSTYRKDSRPIGVYSSNYGRGTPEANGYNIYLSDAYKVAYDLFSPLSDKQWLTRLNALASKAATGADSWTDDLGLTQDGQARRIEAYNTALANIQNLINEYYKWKNSLPVTQVQQAADAGVNLAVSGDINSSDLNASPSNSAAVSGQGSNTIGTISGAMSAVSGVIGTLSSLYKSVEDVKIARDNVKITRDRFKFDQKTFLTGFWKQLSDDGFDMSNYNFESFDDMSSFMNGKHSDPEMLRRATDSLKKYINSDLSFYPIRRNFIDSETGEFVYNPDKFMYDTVGADSMDQFDQTMQIFAQYELQTMLLNKLTEFNEAVYNENYSANVDGTGHALSENATASFTRSTASLNDLRNSINEEFISSFADEWHKNKSPEARFALLTMVSNMNLDSQSFYELIQVLGSPTLAKGADKVIGELIDVGGDFAKRLSSITKKRKK